MTRIATGELNLAIGLHVNGGPILLIRNLMLAESRTCAAGQRPIDAPGALIVKPGQSRTPGTSNKLLEGAEQR